MKKWLVISLAVVGVLLTSAYVFFPKAVDVSNIEKINCNINSVNRFMMAEDKWVKWWPGTIKHDSLSNRNVFVYNGSNFVIRGNKYYAVDIQMQKNDFAINGTMYFFPIRVDSVQAEWKYSLATSSSLINRIHLHREANKINNDIMDIMKSMKAFLEKTENVYGMRIDQVIVRDTILVTTKFSSVQYPSTPKIYQLISGIRNYISVHNAKETNFPMLHVWQDNSMYHTTVAIPVDRKIPENETYSIKRMVPGKILVSEVRGGLYTTTEALKQLGNFMSDNNLSSPAIPFESLVTNRMEEPDTSKWVTKIYYPVF
jgi:effector-binding domain-containing protein